ncbi:MAG: M61 family peptidase [Leptospiraceae bacterium]|nr:M61 family peptidase [Leptospiraceae bacterium]
MNTNHIEFEVTIQNPHLHYFHVKAIFPTDKKKIKLSLPAWSPGSYMIRDYITHLHDLRVKDENGLDIKFEFSDLETIKIHSNSKKVIVYYTIYSFESTVRNNYLDSSYGFIQPTALFLFNKKNLDSKIKIKFILNGYFQHVYSSLNRSGLEFFAEDFDELYDSPFQISNNQSKSFETSSTKHEVIVEGKITDEIYNDLLRDLKIITEYETQIFQGNPNKYYLFIINLTEDNYGGLEHRASSVNAFDPSNLAENHEYNRLLALLAHEYFHLWNVKRIRPNELGPFDYLKPNLTKELWIAEGITSFYDNYVLYKNSFYYRSEYIDEVLKDINTLTESIADERMSLEESSFSTWVKFYKKNNNSHNNGISYYVKGAVFSFCLNLRILQVTESQRSLDDVMRYLNEEFAKKDIGITKYDFFDSVEKITGIDLLPEFDEYLSQKKRIPIEKYFSIIGYVLEKKSKQLSLPFEMKTSSGNEIVSKIFEGLIQNTDIQIGDEIIAVNNQRASKQNLEKILAEISLNHDLAIIISRKAIIKTVHWTPKVASKYFISYPISIAEFEDVVNKNLIAKKFFEVEKG